MKTLSYVMYASGIICLLSCNSESTNEQTEVVETVGVENAIGQSGVQDNESAKNIVQVASSSSDHTTLVTAVKAAELVDVLSNAGPFTIFAPTNDAFNKLPAGTVEGLLKPEKLETLQDILQYHAFVGVLQADALQDEQILGMVNGGNITVSVKAGKILINDKATILTSITTSNGVIHVIDEVLLPN